MKPRRFILLFALLISLAALCGCGKAGPHPLCILHTNDVHGHISPERVKGWKKRVGGSAVLAGCIEAIRAENRRKGIPTLLLDAGDIFMGTPEGNVSEGLAVTEIMNAAGYDALAIGNHEFDHGLSSLETLAESAAFPFLGANVFNSATGYLPGYLRAYIDKDFGDLRVGVIGVVTPETPAMVMPGKVGRITFKEPEEVVRNCLAALRNKRVEFTVVLSHLGYGEDAVLASSVGGIGVIIGGHSHDIVKKPLRIPGTGTIICQAGSYGKYLGRLDLTVDPKSGRAVEFSYELISITEESCPPDPSVEAIVKKWRARVGNQFDEKIGHSHSDFTGESGGESQIGDIVADSMREATGAQIAFHNSYGIRNPLLKGTITYRDTYKVMPFDNTLYTMLLTGGQVREILEQSLSPRRGILQVSGIRVDYNPAAPDGRRVMAVICGDEELDDDKLYSVVTNSYLAMGGDYYKTFTRGENVLNTAILDRDALNDYIRDHSPLSSGGFRPSRLIAR